MVNVLLAEIANWELSFTQDDEGRSVTQRSAAAEEDAICKVKHFDLQKRISNIRLMHSICLKKSVKIKVALLILPNLSLRHTSFPSLP